MDFIKKNWGLVLCSAIFLAVVGFLGVMIYSERQKYNASEKAISTLDGNFSKMNKAGWKVDRKRENAIVAEKNADVAKGHYDDIVRKLFEHSAFELPELPENYIKAQERLDSELRAMQVEVLREKINWQDMVASLVRPLTSFWMFFKSLSTLMMTGVMVYSPASSVLSHRGKLTALTVLILAPMIWLTSFL